MRFFKKSGKSDATEDVAKDKTADLNAEQTVESADLKAEQTEESTRETAEIFFDVASQEVERTETGETVVAFDANSSEVTADALDGSSAENENASPVEVGASDVADVSETSEEAASVAETSVGETNGGAERDEETVAIQREILDVAKTLRQDFDVKFKFDKKKDEQIDRLYEECKAYRDDVFWTLKKDLFLDVAREIDDVEKRAAYFEKCERTPELCEKLLKFAREIAENLRFALEKHDVVAYSATAGSRFDPARQRVLEVKTTNDETLDKTIEPLRKGFDYEANGKTRNVRKEIVYVYKYEPPLVADEPSQIGESEATERDEASSAENDAASNAVPEREALENANER